jgi:NAD(P)-dependent dehydrogenase (short-subunit alcohol dehydrogenase family)
MMSKGKRIAWVTGGGIGIGLTGAEALAADGWTVAISGRRFDVLADATKRIGDKAPGTVDVFPVDVARADNVQAVAQSILAKYGQIDQLVNMPVSMYPGGVGKSSRSPAGIRSSRSISAAFSTHSTLCYLRGASGSPAASLTSHHGPGVSSLK